MAANEIKLTLRVNDDNTLSIVGKKAKEAAAATDKLDKSSKSLNKTRNNYQKIEKGVGQAGLSSAKGFSKQAQAIQGGLVPAYAVLAANVFAVTAAFGVMQRAAAVEQLKQGLIEVGNAAGRNLPFVAQQLREISGAAVSTEQAMRATAVAMSAGFSTSQLQELTKVAKGASLALGRDMGDALDRLVRGTAKLEPEILDELGIMVRLDDAVREYATANNIATDSITQFDRRQAFLNATIEQGAKKFDEIANVVDVNPYDKLAASFSDLAKTLTTVISVGLEPFINFLNSSPFALGGAIAALSGSIVRQLTPALTDMAANASRASARAIANARKSNRVLQESYKKLSSEINSMSFRPPSVKLLENDFKQGAVSGEKLERRLKTVTKMITERDNAVEKGSFRGKKITQERIDGLKEERRQLELLKAKLIEVQQAEQTRLGYTPKGDRQRARGRMDRTTAVALEAMDQAGPIKSMGIALSRSGKMLSREWKAANGVLNTTVAVAGAATRSLKLLGAATLRLIPFIGQAVMAFQLFKGMFPSLFESQSKLNQQTLDVVASFENFAEINNRLANIIEDTTVPATDKLFASFKAGGGIVESINSGLSISERAFKDAIRAQIQDLQQQRLALQEIEEGLKSGNDIRSTVDQLRALFGSAASDSASTLGAFIGPFIQQDIPASAEEAGAAIVKLEDRIKSFRQELQGFDRAGQAFVVQGALDQLANNPAIASALADEVKQYEKYLKDLTDPASADYIDSAEENERRRKELGKDLIAFMGAVGAFDGTFSNLQSQIQNFGNKTSTQFSKITKAFDAVRREAERAFTTKGDEGFAAFLGQNPAFEKNSKELIARIREVGGAVEENFDFFSRSFYGMGMPEALAATKAVSKQLQDNDKIISASIATQKAYNAQAKMLKDVSKEIGFFKGQEFDFTNKAKEAELEGVKATLNSLNSLEKTDYVKSLIVQNTFRQKVLELEIADVNLRQLEVDQADLLGRKKLNDLLTKGLKIEQDILKAKDASEKRTLEIDRASRGSGVNAQDNLALFRKNQDKRRELEREAFRLRMQAINIEFSLLDIKFQLEKQRALNNAKALAATNSAFDLAAAEVEIERVFGQILGPDGVITTQLANSLVLAARQAGMKIPEGGFQFGDRGELKSDPDRTGTGEDEAKDAKLALAAQQELRSIESARISAAAALNRAAGNEASARRKDKARAEAEEKRIALEIVAHRDKIKELTSEGKSTTAEQAELDKKITDELKEQAKIVQANVAARVQAAEDLRAIAGDTMGSFADFSASMINQFEKGGVFAAGSDATLGEKFKAFREASEGIIENLRSIGPEGEISAAVVEGAMFVSETMLTTFESIEGGGTQMAQTLSAVFATAAAGINAISNIMAAKSRQQTGIIDEQIRSEQERDGQSAKSVAKIKALEGRKEAIARKAFEQNKKLQMASVVASTAAAIMQVWANPLDIALGKPIAKIMTGFLVGLGAAQLAAIASTSYSGSGSSSSASGATGPSAVSMGSRGSSVDVGRRAGSGELAYLRGARGMGTGPQDFIGSAFYGKKMRAAGGAVAGYTVGEQGPELFVPEVPGTIVPNDDVGMGQNVNVSFNVQAIDASSFNDALTVQRGNIIEIIREAANSSGEGFLESVDTQSLI